MRVKTTFIKHDFKSDNKARFLGFLYPRNLFVIFAKNQIHNCVHCNLKLKIAEKNQR